MTLLGDAGEWPLRISFDRIADRYDETRAYAEGVPQRIAEALERELTTGCQILEVGVGTGRIAGPLQAHGFGIVGLDISTGMLARARGKGVSDVLLADVTELPFTNDAFDHVLSVHVTHLISEWRAALSEMSRVASDRLVSIVTERDGCDVEAMQHAYEELCAEEGFEVRHPGMRERDLSDMVHPVRVVPVAENVEMADVAETIERYRSRTFSDQWNVPDDVHEQAIERLEGRFEGVAELERRERVSMMVWSVTDIRAAVSVTGR